MRKAFSILLFLFIAMGFAGEVPVFEEADENEGVSYASYLHWQRYKANFGMEKIFIRFPQKPVVTQSSTLLTVYAYDHLLLYSFSGYYPPVGNIDPKGWIDEVITSVSVHPFTCLNHVAYQNGDGDWVLDYVAHDYVKNLIIKARAVITPFNAFTMQCSKPNGTRDQFNYFMESFMIKCECPDD